MKAKNKGYFDRDNNPITKEAWLAFRLDPSYLSIRLYDNEVVHLELLWHGVVDNPNLTFPSMYPLFYMVVMNYNGEGKAVPDPVENGKSYATIELGIAAYEKFLERWTNSSKEEGVFVEKDNLLTPPPPPNPDAPAAKAEYKNVEIDDCGAW